jgi:hypothetical protein
MRVPIGGLSFFCGFILSVDNTYRKEVPVTDPLPELEKRRSELLLQFTRLNDLRPGSVTGLVRRCGKPSCHCAQPDDPGHGPTLRLTYKVRGKTISETLPTPQAVRKVEHEIAEFRKYQELSRAFVEVNEKICHARPVEDTLTPEEKNRGRDPNGGRARSNDAVVPHLCRAQADWRHRPGGG